MIFIIAFSTLISLAYAVLILRFRGAIGTLSAAEPARSSSGKLISIIVPFRNERENLKALLHDLARLDYPPDKFELILVDDHSEDGSDAVVRSFFRDREYPFRLLKTEEGAGKKAALRKAWREARGEIIVQTDADCRVPRSWLQHLAGNFSTNTVLVAGLVRMKAGRNFWSTFAALEFMSLQAITAGTIVTGKAIMASGANLAYRRKLTNKPITGGKRLSGDDTFLLQSAGNKGQVLYLIDPRSATETSATQTFGELLNQRARWGGKTLSYPSAFARMLAVLVVMVNVQLPLILAGAWLAPTMWYLLAGLFLVKTLADRALLRRFAALSGQRSLLKIYWSASLMYPLYILLTGLLIIFGKAEWKGREFRPVTD